MAENQPSAFCLDLKSWRRATPREVLNFVQSSNAKEHKKPKSEGLQRYVLNVRQHLRPVDVYSYLIARFGRPNGFQNFLRKDDSDNLVHWDFLMRSGETDIYIAGVLRELQIVVTEPLSDEQWKSLIVGLKQDFKRVAMEKSAITKTFEKFIVFQNKFVSIASLCADLHDRITDAPKTETILTFPTEDEDIELHKTKLDLQRKGLDELFGNCLKLKLMTPIMAEAFINMVILTFCKDRIRNDRKAYEGFVRARIPERLNLLPKYCDGFDKAIDRNSTEYKDFMRIVNERNFLLHGNVDPMRESIETVYFEGKRPLFVTTGDSIQNLFDQLDRLVKPDRVMADYEAAHAFLFCIRECLTARHNAFFEHVISDGYPGYELKKKRVTRILPDYRVAARIEGLRYDDELNVSW